jgi:two-component system, NarL family, response regulator LiaR
VIRILVVDDHPIVREGLVAVLADEPDFAVVGSAGSAEDALTLAERLQPDVLLLDLELPGMSGVEAISHFARRVPATRILVFTAYDADEQVFGALRAGAKGYLLKGAASAEIARAVRVVDAGGSHLEPQIASRVLAEVATPSTPSISSTRPRFSGPGGGLSEREGQVLRLIAAGNSNKAIARQLAIAERTAKFHVTSLMNKLGAANRAQTVAIAVQRGLL